MLAVCALRAAPQEAPVKAEQREGLALSKEEPPAPTSLGAIDARLRSELARNPTSAETLYRLGLVLRQEQKPKESLEIYTRAAGLQKPDADQLRSVALDYVLLNDFDDAIHWLRVALSLDSRNVNVLYSLGRCFYTQNHFAEAEAAFVRVLQVQPEHLKAGENLGLTYDAENKPELAEKYLRAAAARADQQKLQDPWPFFDLGAFLLDQQRAAEALPYLRNAAGLDPSSAASHEKLGRALLATADVPNGLKELLSAVRLEPESPKFHFELGRAYRDAGEQEKARAEFDRSKKLYGAHNQN